jgi:hypothetical protein
MSVSAADRSLHGGGARSCHIVSPTKRKRGRGHGAGEIWTRPRIAGAMHLMRGARFRAMIGADFHTIASGMKIKASST